MNNKKTKIIVTLGPSTSAESDLRKIKDKGVDFVRVNLSHSSLEYFEQMIKLSKKVGIPFMIDTEGSQVRIGDLAEDTIHFKENQEVYLYAKKLVGNSEKISLRPGNILEQLQAGDLIYIDFDTLILRVMDIFSLSEKYIKTKAISGGIIGGNKAVVIDPVFDKKFHLPTLSPKDHSAIKLGLQEGIKHIAVSFVRSAKAIEEVREVTQNKMKIISKIECVDALENIDEIIQNSDYILIDRGDLSKEIPMEKIPLTQKLIVNKASRFGVGVFVATNLLETMIEKKHPTRAEVQDVVNTIIDGAMGLILAAETAIGKYPMECINMLNKIIEHTETVIGEDPPNIQDSSWLKRLEASNYPLENMSSSLNLPNGGTLVNRILSNPPDKDYLNSIPKIKLDTNQQMDVELIANGAYSPVEGFMGEDDFQSVLDELRLASGVIWPLPIVLNVSEKAAEKLSIGDVIGLTNEEMEVVALLELDEKYRFDRSEAAEKIYGTNSEEHPGVERLYATEPVLLAGKINLIKRRDTDMQAYQQSPRQIRRLFIDRGWAKVVGFHTRNVIHRGHEYMQLKAMENENCDGLFLHPVIGEKKAGDFKPEIIINSYEKMISTFYPKDKVVLAAFSTYSRYAGPREAIFTALCRKNYGCSHFIIGRDHTGVGDYYDQYASHRIFDDFPDLGIKIVKFREIYFSKKLNSYEFKDGKQSAYGDSDKLHFISGSQAREIFLKGERPPEWFMRPEIAKIVQNALLNGEQVFE